MYVGLTREKLVLFAWGLQCSKEIDGVSVPTFEDVADLLEKFIPVVLAAHEQAKRDDAAEDAWRRGGE